MKKSNTNNNKKNNKSKANLIDKTKKDNKNKQPNNLSIKEAIKDVEEHSYDIEENSNSNKSDLNSEDSQLNEKTKYIVSKRAEKLKKNIEGFNIDTGVIYISHLPWGINEANLKKYFDQFGKITRYILPRSKISGRIKGYAFIEFESIDIADIASRTMNNFILFNKIIKCETVNDRSRYNSIFKRWKKQFKYFNRYKAFVVKRNKKKSYSEIKDQVKLMLEKENKKRQKLKDMNINYDFPGFNACLK